MTLERERILTYEEIFMASKAHHPVAGLPIQPHGYGGDAFGSILH